MSHLLWFRKRTRVGGTETAFYYALVGWALGGTLSVRNTHGVKRWK